MADKEQLLQHLRVALNDPATRSESIKRFQSAVFNGDRCSLGVNDFEWDLITELAQDLDYYEQDEDFRREDPSFYGDECVEAEIKDALGKLAASASGPKPRECS
jgi:hypothetical protein